MIENNNDKKGVPNLSINSLAKQAKDTLARKQHRVDTRNQVGRIYTQDILLKTGNVIQQVRRHVRDAQGNRHIQIAKLEWPESPK